MKTLTIIDGIKIILLPSEKLNTETMCICIKENGLLMDALHLGRLGIPCTKADLKDPRTKENFAPVHAYVLSDKKIKKGDWVYSTHNSKVFKVDVVEEGFVGENQDVLISKKYCTKIGSTTDRKLVRDIQVGKLGVVHKRLPSLSDDFMDRLCYHYNKQNNC